MSTRYARYTTFTVGNATTDYLLLLSGYSGTAGDGMSTGSGRKFQPKAVIMIYIQSTVQCITIVHGGIVPVPLPIDGRYYHVETTAETQSTGISGTREHL